MKVFTLKIFALAAFLSGVQWLSAQSITGKVTDGQNEEALVGVTVRLMDGETLKGGAYTDDSGEYSIMPVQPGTYTLIFSYVSYVADTVTNVSVAAGQDVTLDRALQADVQETVIIYSKVERNSEAQVLNLQRRSTSVVDVISIENITRAGDSDVGSAMKRMTGVTVEGGKYVYVRGLSDRYSKTLLNGNEIPGLDPDRNSVQMDLFPSNLVDNVVVHKTYSPDLPGDFAGGLIKITTKDFPRNFTIGYSSSLGFNPQANLNKNFIEGTRGRFDWLGFDDGTRAAPEFVSDPNTILPAGPSFNNASQAGIIDSASNAFDTPIYARNRTSGVNHSHSFSIGNQTYLRGRPLGYVASISYQNNESYYENGQSARWKLTNAASSTSSLTPLLDLRDQSATRDVLWGALGTLSYVVGRDQQLRLSFLHNQSGTSNARFLTGSVPEADPDITFETRVVSYRQRSMDAVQLSGYHKFGDGSSPGKFGRLEFNWTGAYTRTSQNEPDLRYFSNDYLINTQEDTVYQIQQSLYRVPTRFFRSMTQDNIDFKGHFELPFEGWTGQEGKIKFGGSALYKARDFREEIYDFRIGSGITPYAGNEASFFDDSNLGVVGTDTNGLYLYGLYLVDASQIQNSYLGDQAVYAGYGMAEANLSERLRLIAGGRYELTNIEVQSRDQNLPTGSVSAGDFLPSVNLIYSLNQDSLKNIMNIRASYSRTLARPTFRELAPFASFAFIRDFVLIGNDTLRRTNIDNFDLRWELFPTSSEIVSVSAFYKRFKNPIERVINPVAQNIELNYRNVPEALLYGAEFEFRKKLDFLGNPFKDLRASANLTLIQSRLDINPSELALIRALDANAPSTRQMFGQSPYTINGELSYVNDSIGLNTSLNFNVFGARISNVSTGGTPNVFEQPRPRLDFSVAKSFGKVSVRFRARNLLNPEYLQTHTLNGNDFVFSSYQVGRSYSLGISYRFEREEK